MESKNIIISWLEKNVCYKDLQSLVQIFTIKFIFYDIVYLKRLV